MKAARQIRAKKDRFAGPFLLGNAHAQISRICISSSPIAPDIAAAQISATRMMRWRRGVIAGILLRARSRPA